MHTQLNRRSNQAGITIVELMVALAISMFILSGVITVFVANKQNYRVQQNMAAIQDNGRFAIDMLSRNVRMSGYQGVDAFDWVLGTLLNSIDGTDNTAVAGLMADTDTLTVTFQAGDADHADCLGQRLNASDTVVETFSVDASGNLQCASTVTPDGGVSVTTGPLDLVEGVDSMQVLYGMNTDSDGVANQFVPYVNTLDMNDVLAVRVGLLLSSPDDNVALDTDIAARNLLDAVVAAPNDKRIRRFFITTIRLRNHL